MVGLQEVRCSAEQLPAELRRLRAWSHFLSCAERPGYSGVALLSRLPLEEIRSELGAPTFDSEGRLQIARCGRLTVVNSYFPNGQGKNRDNRRIPFKLEYYRRLFEKLRPGFEAGERILVMGDFNTAHREIDLARPRENAGTSGFTPPEREELDRWIRAGWVDTFRAFCPDPGHYTWWSQRSGVRRRNIGWRIDYVLASPGAAPFVTAASIHSRVEGSDHCPISVDLDEAVLR
jgi:exodeoxyribonuclease-3